MLFIVGLGNPGRQYEHTRHNAGFMLVDRLSETAGIRFDRAPKALWGKGSIAGEEVLLIKPQTFMNLSGDAVAEALRVYPVPVPSIIVAYDDCDLPLGRLRIRRSGGSGGHRGVASVTERLGSVEFPRIRLGVGRPPHGSIVDYVLSPFTPEERDTVDGMLEKGAASVEALITEGIESAMNRFNSSD